MANDKTKWIFDDNEGDVGQTGDGDFTESLGTTPNRADYTQPPQNNESTRLVQTQEKTQIYQQEGFDEEIDPVVGWLVIVKGPGLGQAINLGAGMNTVGRDASQRVSLPFGDTLISSQDHTRIIYDDTDRAFHIAAGSGKNITKANGQMVASIMPLENYSLIELSKATHARFVLFCNKNFDWSDVSSDETA